MNTKSESLIDHIGVCVPTFRRPELLRELLSSLGRQKCNGLFHYSVHVVDNDAMRSGESIVAEFARAAPCLITYDVEPVQNIALARNRAVRSARGNFIAFIDDDEVATESWLLTLYLVCREYSTEGVLGPVRPLFGSDAPLWLEKSGLCERPWHKTGTILTHLQTRTGNAFLKREILDGVPVPFSPDKGRTGGEDIEFFRFMIARGCVFVWCEEAPVYERVTLERCNRGYYVNKSLRIGGLTGEMLRERKSGKWSAVFGSMCALVLHASGAAAGLLRGYHVFVRHSVKAAYHLARMCGCFGFVPVRYRRDA